MLTVVHVVNQFFAGLGGEEKADAPVGVLEGAAGATRALQAQLGAQARIVSTIFCGDNYFPEHPDETKEAVLKEIRDRKPQVIVAGPAFSSGRYGHICVELCQTVADALHLPCVAAMHPENPAVSSYREYHNERVFLLPTAETAAGMADAVKALARFACRLGSGAEIGPADEEGYLPRGIRRIAKAERRGAERALEMLRKKVRNEPFASEVPIEVWDRVTPAAPLRDPRSATIAMITTSGLVPWGNPDGFKIFRNTHWRKYSIAGQKQLEPGRWEAVHGGYNVSFINKNPHYGLPLDSLRELETEKEIGRIHPEYYVVPGNMGAPTEMRRIGQEIAADLRKEGADGVLLVST